ncbi:lyase family protein [Halanaerobium praevalens]|uniref:Fumarate lyase n=1 Tax=Halanaerobium praevalens (strain ATCC 33744 / DSM 2228 / GSL) TaxID=572479 RepID=E3DMB8_HALPG|nr:lyase family protein [Halanaerobium praevalens]ADO76311.1 fumarate lyase [Halanaerobium praevalens DSM 2228]
MQTRDIFANISPLDHRYSRDEDDYAEISKYLSEKATIALQAEVELALIKVLAARGLAPQTAPAEVEKAIAELTTAEVYAEEAKTKHNIRALVNCLQKKVSKKCRPFLHFTATSYDIVDTANSLRYQKTARELILPRLKKLHKSWAEIAFREKDRVQIGRTHGQHAVPITFGFTIAEYVARLGERIEEIEAKTDKLVGKFAGAVGAYNASSIFFDDPEAFEKEVLAELGLKAGEHSTQIVQAEPMTDFVHTLVSTFSVLAAFADDMRQLQRSEIAEIGEFFAKDQVGSSTMPHKRNPINYENVKSLWKAFMPQMTTVYLDQLSEHQRDLTNSASSRFIPELITALLSAVSRLTRVSSKMVVDQKNMQKNFEQNKKMIVAEPLYILLAAAGHPDAHEAVRKLTLEAQKTDLSLKELVAQSKELKGYWENFRDLQKEIILKPEKYTGIAAQKTEKIVKNWQKKFAYELQLEV